MEDLDLSLDDAPEWTDGAEAPQEGENVTAALKAPGDGPVRPSLRKAFNRLRYVRPGAEQSQYLSLVPWVEMYAPGDDGVGGFGNVPTGITLRAVGPWLALIGPKGPQHGSRNSDKNLAAPVGGWVRDSWYYLYVYLDGAGLVQLEASLTPPFPALTTKITDPTRKYLGHFRTYQPIFGGPVAIVPFRSARGRYIYERDFGPLPGYSLVELATNLGGGWQSIPAGDFDARIAPHIRQVTLAGMVVAFNNAVLQPSGALQVKRGGATDGKILVAYDQVPIGALVIYGGSGTASLPLQTGGGIDWQLPAPTNPGGGGKLTASIAVSEVQE